MIRRLSALAACLCLAPIAAQSDAVATAQIAAEAIRDAAAEIASADSARDRVAALTSIIQAHETGLSSLRVALREVTLEERALRARLETEGAELSRLLAAMTAIGRDAEAAPLLHPQGPAAAVRASLLLGAATDATRTRMEALSTDLERVETLRASQDAARDALQSGLITARDARTALSQAVSERRELPPPVATDTAALEALLNGAETLDGFAATLVANTPTEEDGRALVQSAPFPLPANGTVLAGFGAMHPNGVTRPGLSIGIAPLALITAPRAATVRYAGPLLDYGQVAILELEPGKLMVLAGLSALYVETTEIVDGGAPIGVGPGNTETSQDNLIDTAQSHGQDRQETLYIELRTGNGPVDPAPWFDLGEE